jgi:two-component system, NarL family, invasion response regulator UvrY
MPLPRVLIADDQAIIRRGLQLILSEANEWNTEEVTSPEEMFGRLRAEAIEVLVMSRSFAQDFAVLGRIKADFPNLPVLIFNCQRDDLAAMRSLRAGASGYMETVSSPDDLLEAVRRIEAGGTYISQGIAAKIAAGLARGEEGEGLLHRLSRREQEVFQLLGTGKSVGEIARKLKISVKTVSTHRSRILEKTGMRNNADIIRYTILNNIRT